MWKTNFAPGGIRTHEYFQGILILASALLELLREALVV